MIKKQWKIIEKLKKKYALKQFLRQQDFDKLNPILISLNHENNAKKFARSKNLVGFNLEAAFLGYLQKYFFKRKTKKIPKAKIERLIKKNKVLKEKQKNQLHFRLVQAQSLLCFGNSGSGKTQNLVLPTIFANALSPMQPNLLITSTSEKIAKASFTFLQNQGYQVKVLNFFDQYSSDSFSPLIFLQELIWKLVQYPFNTAQNVKGSKTAKLKIINELEQELSQFFAQLNEIDELQDENLLNNALKILQVAAWLLIDDLVWEYQMWVLDNPDIPLVNKKLRFNEIFVKFSFQSMSQILSFWGQEGLRKYASFYQIKYEVKLDWLAPEFVSEHPGLKHLNLLRQNNISEIMQAALKLLMKFQVKTITNLSLFNTFDLNDFYSNKQQPLALFILIDPADLITLPYALWLLNFLVQQIHRLLYQQEQKKLTKPLVCLFDDLGLLPPIKALPALINEGQESNIYFGLFFQTYQQYHQRYGHSGVDFMRICSHLVILETAETELQKRLIDLVGMYQWKDKKSHQYNSANRLNSSDFVNTNLGALVIQKDFPVPYKTNLLPWSILNFPVLKYLEIPISDPAFRSQKDLIYNPLSPENQLSLEEAIAIDFDFYHHPEYTLSLKAKQKLLKQLERIVSLCLNLENKEYWLSKFEKLEAQPVIDDPQQAKQPPKLIVSTPNFDKTPIQVVPPSEQLEIIIEDETIEDLD